MHQPVSVIAGKAAENARNFSFAAGFIWSKTEVDVRTDVPSESHSSFSLFRLRSFGITPVTFSAVPRVLP